MHTQYTELCNTDISGDPSSSFVLGGNATTYMEKGFTHASCPTIALSTAVLIFHVITPFFPYTPTHCGPIKSQGQSLENLGSVGSCSGSGEGKEKDPLLLFSQCTLFFFFLPPSPIEPSGCKEVTALPHLSLGLGTQRDAEGRGPQQG